MLWAWIPNGGPKLLGSQRAITFSAYPGDAYVDIIGLNMYHGLFSATELTNSLNSITQFATEGTRRKMTAINEYGPGMDIKLLSGDNNKGGFDSTPSAQYVTADVVTHTDGDMYRAKTTVPWNGKGVAMDNSAYPTATAYWDPAYRLRGAYNGGTTYNRTDIVTSGTASEYGGRPHYWVCRLNGVVGVTPSSSATAQWAEFVIDGYDDYPAGIEALQTWLSAEVAAGRLHHFMPFETDPAKENTYHSLLTQQFAFPGRKNYVIPTTSVKTNFPNMAKKAYDYWKS